MYGSIESIMRKCPNCLKVAFDGAYNFDSVCQLCGFTGWDPTLRISPGSGSGRECPGCGGRTLFKLVAGLEDFYVFQCTRCPYSGASTT